MSEKQYVKVYCPKADCSGLITIENNNGVRTITNFYELDKELGKKDLTNYFDALPMVAPFLKEDATRGGRVPMSVDKSRGCAVGRGELWYQCLYCNNLEVCKKVSGGYDIYFLMDESGSMEDDDRLEAADAVREFISTLQGDGNTYSFVAFGSRAGYVFKHETNKSSISSALKLYEDDETGYQGSTAAHLAFSCIKDDVLASKKHVCVIFVTDGYFDDEKAAVKARNELLVKQGRADIIAIGITGANSSSLKKVGTIDKFSKIISSKDLGNVFVDVAKELNGQN